MNEVIAAFLFFLPAGIANTTPVIANKVPFIKNWHAPVDFGKKWRGQRLLGKNKTWRGILTGTICGGLVGVLIHPLTDNQHSLLVALGLSLIMGFGALLGDAVESGFKRQMKIPSGHSWFPFDQIDYIIGGLVLVYPFSRPSWQRIGIIIVIFFALHLLVAYLAFLARLKDKPI